MVKYLDSNKSWVTPEVESSNQGRIRLEMSRVATTRQVCADGLIRLQLRRAFQFGLHLDWKLCYMTAVWCRYCEVY